MPPSAIGTAARNQDGIALIAVLWAVLLLALLAQGFLTETTTTVQLTRNLIEGARAQALADGAVHIGIDRLLQERRRHRTPGPLAPLSLSIDGARVTVTIEGDAGKIDLNRAPAPLLVALLRSAGAEESDAEALAAAVFDWRDRDSLRRLRGAEDADYRRAGLPHDAKDDAFAAVDELRMVLGFTPELYNRVAPALTVHSHSRGIDPRHASAAVLNALAGERRDIVPALLAARQLGDTAAINATIRELGLSRRFLTSSRRSSYTIRVRVEMESGTVFVREAIVRLTRGGMLFGIVDWRTGWSHGP